MNMLRIKSFFVGIFSWLWRKKRWTLSALILLGILVFWLGKKYLAPKSNSDFFSNDYEVMTGEVSNSLSMMGTTQFANAQKLTFVNKGRVTSVKTKIGAQVKKGDVLATITTDDLDREVETAKKNLKNQQLKLQQILEKSNKELDILRAQSNYDLLLLQKQTLPSEQLLDIQTKKSELQELERQIKDKEKELKEAQNDHSELLSGKAGANNAELSISKVVRARNTTMDKLIRDFRESANALQATIDSYDRLLGMTEAYSIEEPYLFVRNEAALVRSHKQFWKVKSYIKKLQDTFTAFSGKNP